MANSPQKTLTIRDLKAFDDLEQAEALEQRSLGTRRPRRYAPGPDDCHQRAGSIWSVPSTALSLPDSPSASSPWKPDTSLSIPTCSRCVSPTAISTLDTNSNSPSANAPSRDASSLAREMTWTFDPLQSRNAHLPSGKLGVVSETYKVDFYGPETSTSSTTTAPTAYGPNWPLASRRVRDRLQGKDFRPEVLDAFSRLQPLVQFNGDGQNGPLRNDLPAALSRQRIAIQIPSDILTIEKKIPMRPRMAGSHALGLHRSPARRILRGRIRPHRPLGTRPRQLPAGKGLGHRLRSRAAEKT